MDCSRENCERRTPACKNFQPKNVTPDFPYDGYEAIELMRQGERMVPSDAYPYDGSYAEYTIIGSQMAYYKNGKAMGEASTRLSDVISVRWRKA